MGERPDPPTQDELPRPVTVIRPTAGIGMADLAEAWAYRELLGFFVWRDLKVRYKQTVLGAAWAILQPLVAAAVFTVIFGRLAGIGSDGLPYSLFSYCGLLVWTYFGQGVTQCSESLVGSAKLITKVYFPRLVMPVAAVMSGLVNLVVALPVLLVMMYWFDVRPGPQMLAVPLILALAVVTVLAVGILTSAVNVKYRDVRHVVPFMVQIWLFLTPVIYPASAVTSKLAERGLPTWLLGLNPMAGVVEGFRWAMLGTSPAPVALLTVGWIVAGCLSIISVLYFRKVERTFADVV
jgi:lipopolysaccharide transport system permease protein